MRNALHLMKMPGANRELVGQARGVLERQLQYLVRMVDDLLDVSRIIRGHIELRREAVDVAVAIARAIETAQPTIDAKHHELAVAVPDQPLWWKRT